MSISIEIACRTCKVKLNIGQSSSEYDKDFNHRWESFIYADEAKTMADFNQFLNDHVMRCHKVIMCSDGDGDPYCEETCDMEDYEPQKKAQ